MTGVQTCALPILNALIGLGCVLFFVTFVVLVIARILVSRVKQY